MANKYELLIIEDDCLGDLNYEQVDNRPLKSFDDEERVIYIKSFSNIFMDGLVQRVLDLYFREEVWEQQLTTSKQTHQQRYRKMK